MRRPKPMSLAELVRSVVDKAPPLTPQQLANIAVLLSQPRKAVTR